MALVALLRSSGRNDSATSTAPDAHSPPMPRPSNARQIASCTTLCEVAAPSEQIEYMRMVMLRARTRPMRSAITPNDRPPTAALTSVNVPSNPAVASPKPKYDLSRPMAKT